MYYLLPHAPFLPCSYWGYGIAFMYRLIGEPLFLKGAYDQLSSAEATQWQCQISLHILEITLYCILLWLSKDNKMLSINIT